MSQLTTTRWVISWICLWIRSTGSCWRIWGLTTWAWGITTARWNITTIAMAPRRMFPIPIRWLGWLSSWLICPHPYPWSIPTLSSWDAIRIGWISCKQWWWVLMEHHTGMEPICSMCTSRTTTPTAHPKSIWWQPVQAKFDSTPTSTTAARSVWVFWVHGEATPPRIGTPRSQPYCKSCCPCSPSSWVRMCSSMSLVSNTNRAPTKAKRKMKHIRISSGTAILNLQWSTTCVTHLQGLKM